MASSNSGDIPDSLHFLPAMVAGCTLPVSVVQITSPSMHERLLLFIDSQSSERLLQRRCNLASRSTMTTASTARKPGIQAGLFVQLCNVELRHILVRKNQTSRKSSSDERMAKA